jgi:hypothetical protein
MRVLRYDSPDDDLHEVDLLRDELPPLSGVQRSVLRAILNDVLSTLNLMDIREAVKEGFLLGGPPPKPVRSWGDKSAPATDDK